MFSSSLDRNAKSKTSTKTASTEKGDLKENMAYYKDEELISYLAIWILKLKYFGEMMLCVCMSVL